MARSLNSTKYFKWTTKITPAFLFGLIIIISACSSQDQAEPKVVKLDPNEAAEQNKQIEEQVTSEVADGIEVKLWASEQLMGDPVGMDIDNRGRAFVTVSSRSTESEFDIRGHRDWVPHSMTWTTVEDRREFLHQEFSEDKSEQNREVLEDHNEDGSYDWRDLAVQQEEIYVVEDSSGNGIAESSHRFEQGFNTSEITDVLGSVLYDDDSGEVFAAVAPDVWRLKDSNNDGISDSKESISHGYAVHIGFSGHGMSGLIKGPDGKIYWGIGDIGSNVTDQEGKQWENYNRGIIARANPDGSDFEIFAHGVRNTHEFDFDEYGNLISVDNDGDHAGESERIVHLIHGSDTGWRINWQFGKYTDEKNNEYKVWMDEDYFKTRHEGQTAHILPPVALYHSGPAGMTYNPGTALNDKWDNYFFMTEFVGSPRSAVHAFKLKESGASFELEETKLVQRGILGTSLDFGPDGALYVADWIEGWGTNQEGRIWKIDTEEGSDSEIRQETKKLLAEDFTSRSADELYELLKHDDMRVRQKSQFELVKRGETGFEFLKKAAEEENHQLARIHGIWGIGQLARSDLEYAEPLIGLLNDDDSEIKAQAAKVIGDEEYKEAAEELISLLSDESPRAQLYAAEALGKLQYQQAVQPIMDMLEENDDKDAHLRHAGAIALSRIGDVDALVALHESPSRALRIAAVVALKRIGDPGIAQFLQDDDTYIVTDAARAISDDHFIEEAIPDLAALLENSPEYEPLARRVINANLYEGSTEAAQRTAQYATSTAADTMRMEAIRTLGVWPNPSEFDRVTGRHRGPLERDTSIARDAVQGVIADLFNDKVAGVRKAAVEVTGQLKIVERESELIALLNDDSSPQVRIAVLEALSEMESTSMNEAMQTVLDDTDKEVRMAGLAMIPELSIADDEKTALLSKFLEEGTVEEKQVALNALGGMENAEAKAVLEEQVTKLVNGNLDPEVQLDVVLAVEQSGSGELSSQLEQYKEVKEEGEPVEKYKEALRGGNAERGREIFFNNDAAQCVRCHVVDDFGGDVGPPLHNIGAELTREQLLESLVDPGARIAPGYGTIALSLKDGNTVRGIVQEEDESALVIQTPDGTTRKINQENIESRQNDPSSMPPMGMILDRTELRDIVEFLAIQK